MVDFLVSHWVDVCLVLLVADKIVAITPTKHDDLILTAIKQTLKTVKGK